MLFSCVMINLTADEKSRNSWRQQNLFLPIQTYKCINNLVTEHTVSCKTSVYMLYVFVALLFAKKILLAQLIYIMLDGVIE